IECFVNEPLRLHERISGIGEAVGHRERYKDGGTGCRLRLFSGSGRTSIPGSHERDHDRQGAE
ncbi:hypothetical protein ACQ7B2_16295, partial [Escherichia coli]